MSELISTVPVESLPPLSQKAVEVDGFLGIEKAELSLNELVAINPEAQSEGFNKDAFRELYVEEEDEHGNRNTYAILESRWLPSNGQTNEYVVLNQDRNKTVADSGMTHVLSKPLGQEALQNGRLVVGEPFSLGDDATAVITRITGVVAGEEYAPEAFKMLTNGEKSDVRSNFWMAIGRQGKAPYSEQAGQ